MQNDGIIVLGTLICMLLIYKYVNDYLKKTKIKIIFNNLKYLFHKFLNKVKQFHTFIIIYFGI